jgi:hypothetical protein
VITDTDVLDALTKAAAYDASHTPKTSNMLIKAWLEHFERYASAVTREDLLEAVTEHHREPHDRMLTPADLSGIARLLRRDRLERSDTDSPQRLELQARIDAKSQPRPALPSPEAAVAALAEHQARMARIAANFNPQDPDDAKALRYLPTTNPLRHTCPWCEAKPGQRCHIPGTVPRQYLVKARAHPARLEAAGE